MSVRSHPNTTKHPNCRQGEADLGGLLCARTRHGEWADTHFRILSQANFRRSNKTAGRLALRWSTTAHIIASGHSFLRPPWVAGFQMGYEGPVTVARLVLAPSGRPIRKAIRLHDHDGSVGKWQPAMAGGLVLVLGVKVCLQSGHAQRAITAAGGWKQSREPQPWQSAVVSGKVQRGVGDTCFGRALRRRSCGADCLDLERSTLGLTTAWKAGLAPDTADM